MSFEQSLTWKETFVFPLSKSNIPLKIDFLHMSEIKQIHFAEDQVLDGLSIGKSSIVIEVENSDSGTVPAKISIESLEGGSIGTVFIEYEILKTEVNYIVENLMDFEYLLILRVCKVTFVRHLSATPNIYLKLICGHKAYEEKFSFTFDDEIFVYSYPIRVYIKEEKELRIELQIKDILSKEEGHSISQNDTESLASMKNSIVSNKRSKKLLDIKNKKNSIDIEQIEKLVSTLELNFFHDGNFNRKIPVCVMKGNVNCEIGTLEMDIDIIHRSQKEKEQYLIEKQLKKESSMSPNLSGKQKKHKKVQIQKNGEITINSIIIHFEMFNEEAVQNKSLLIELTLGKSKQESTVINKGSLEVIWIDTFIFKRTWEEILKFVIYVYDDSNTVKIPRFYGQVCLRELFDEGRSFNKKVEIRNEELVYCGSLVADMLYKELVLKSRDLPKEKIQSEVQSIKPKHEKKEVQPHIKHSQNLKKKTSLNLDFSLTNSTEAEFLLLPLIKPRNFSSNHNHSTLSPRAPVNSSIRNNANGSVNMFNKGGSIVMSKSPRFPSSNKNWEADSFNFNPLSDFDLKKKRGASIGYGGKWDFTKDYENSPGVGRYRIPSLWDQYG